VTFFTGSLFFTGAGFLTYREAVDAGPHAPGAPRRRFFVYQPARIDTPEGDSAVDHDGQPADNAAIARARRGPSPPSDAAAPGAGTSSRPKARAWRDKGAAAAARIKTGSVGTFWSRLSAVDFMNSALMFAGLFLVCFFRSWPSSTPPREGTPTGPSPTA
jgi:hypothetical protein